MTLYRIEDVECVIRHYKSAVAALIGEMELVGLQIVFFRNPTGTERSGCLPSGAEYWFHGKGIRFHRPDRVVVEWDRGPEDRVDCFDAWRLEEFQRTLGSGALLSVVQFQAALDDGVRKQKLVIVGHKQYVEIGMPRGV
jgi:hypothetical protein